MTDKQVGWFLLALGMVVLIFLFSGCSALAPGATKEIVGVVEKYCVLDQPTRLVNRANANRELAALYTTKGNIVDPATVKIHCPGDKD
jgi:hypothetical protein